MKNLHYDGGPLHCKCYFNNTYNANHLKATVKCNVHNVKRNYVLYVAICILCNYVCAVDVYRETQHGLQSTLWDIIATSSTKPRRL